ncbi:hypothetical protein RB653_010106 [Dictyostelium firmibasis]|uniref:PA14 domain-containing protein n=1 Tax=Dictyostelium firmibasis TaxID=79012 RepID=A0AAN7YTF6_9MYCE
MVLLLYCLGILLISNYLMVNCQILTWFDYNNNPDFDMDSVADNTFSMDYLLAKSQYTPDGLSMVYSYGNSPTYDEITETVLLVNNKSTFNSWTYAEEGSKTTTSGFRYFDFTRYFYSDKFFPVDNLGFGNNGLDHNYKWCARLHFVTFFPPDSQTMNFKASHSDDLFIFIDGVSVYSYIGITEKSDISLDFKKIGYPPSQSFETEIINCNRKYRPDYHLLEIITDFPLQCHHLNNGTCYEVESQSTAKTPVTTIASTATTIVSTIAEIPIETTTTSSSISGGSGSTFGVSTTTSSDSIGSTIGITTLGVNDPCSNIKCGYGKGCYNIDGKPICTKTDCVSCEDLDCPSQGLKCVSFKVNKHPMKKNCQNCCQYIPTCSKY